MSLFYGKSVAVVGPCVQSLEKMDFSELDDFDIVMRTNTFFKITTPTKNDTMRCDSLALNQQSCEYYKKTNLLPDNTHSDFICLVKKHSHMRRIKSYIGKREQLIRPPHYKIRNKAGKRRRGAVEPYLCTFIVHHLHTVACPRVKFFGLDFYYNGFNQQENYPDGYSVPHSRVRHEHRDHSMFVDILLWRDKYLLRKTNTTLDDVSNEFFFKQLERMGHGTNNL